MEGGSIAVRSERGPLPFSNSSASHSSAVSFLSPPPAAGGFAALPVSFSSRSTSVLSASRSVLRVSRSVLNVSRSAVRSAKASCSPSSRNTRKAKPQPDRDPSSKDRVRGFAPSTPTRRPAPFVPQPLRSPGIPGSLASHACHTPRQHNQIRTTVAPVIGGTPGPSPRFPRRSDTPSPFPPRLPHATRLDLHALRAARPRRVFTPPPAAPASPTRTLSALATPWAGRTPGRPQHTSRTRHRPHSGGIPPSFGNAAIRRGHGPGKGLRPLDPHKGTSPLDPLPTARQ